VVRSAQVLQGSSVRQTATSRSRTQARHLDMSMSTGIGKMATNLAGWAT